MAAEGQQVEQMDATSSGESCKRNVMIAMDGSKHAINAFEWYMQHIYKEGDNIIMAHCAEIELPTAALMGSPATVHAMVADYEEEVKKVFKLIDEVANKYKVKHVLERLHKHNRPGEAIVKAAEQQNVHLMICGSRGLGKIRRTIMGSVSDYILHHSHVPVIIVKHEDEHHKLK